MANKLENRVKALEEALMRHLQESGVIQTNLKWNTWMTCAIAVAVIGKIVTEFLKH